MAVNSVVAIVGRANVGKSSLFNRLVGARQAITHETAGTTRDSVYGAVGWGKFNFMLVDTAGLKRADNQLETAIRDQIQQAADGASVIVVVVDATAMPTEEDRQAAKLALKTGRPVILAVNKSDKAGAAAATEFVRLGIKEIAAVSAIQGSGTGDLLDFITAHLDPEAPDLERPLRIAFLGRPNVGKSSLLNSLGGKQQAIVSEVAGTTRDIGWVRLKYHGQAIELLDTAGIEKFSVTRTLGAIAASDICVVLLDATELAVAGDQHIAGMVAEAGKGLILAVNKWDLVARETDSQARTATNLAREFQFVWWAPLLFISAATGLNATKIFEQARLIMVNRQQQISTGPLNRLLATLTAKHPPAGKGHRQPKLNYITQTGQEPPTFAIFASFPQIIHFSYKRFIENGLREAYDFTGTPIRLEFKDKRRAE